MTEKKPILQTEDLEKHFQTNAGILQRLLNRKVDNIHAVDGVDLSLNRQEIHGVIGESGCGKTTLLMTLMGLHDPTDGDIYYQGTPVSEFSRKDWKEYRRNVQIIFQDPFNSLDPKLTVRESIREPLDVHNFDDKEQRVRDAMENVELRPVDRYIDRYPEQLSGGEKQRVSIARGLVLEPDVVLADEPVSMLDVSTQASLLNLMSDLVEELDVAMFYISHDLSTVSYLSDTIHVMYLGRVVESGDVRRILDDPKHPYTKELINAIPIPDPISERKRTDIEGSTPDPINIGQGCRFRDRCPDRMDICEKTPKVIQTDDREVTCHLYYDHDEEVAASGSNKSPRSNPAEDGGVN